MKLKFVNNFPKKIKRVNTTTGIVDTGVITSTMITGGISIAAFASSVGLLAGAALGETSLLLSFVTVITQKYFKIFTVKQEKASCSKHIRQHSQYHFTCNARRRHLHTEFHKALQEVEKYCKLKSDIRNQAKAKIKQITKEKREELLEQGRKEGKKDFLRKITNTSVIQGVNVI